VLVPGLPVSRMCLPRVALGAFFSVCVVARSERTLASDLEVRGLSQQCSYRPESGAVEQLHPDTPPQRSRVSAPSPRVCVLPTPHVQGLLSSSSLADVEFTVHAEDPDSGAAPSTFLAHRAVLAARSPFWATQFMTGMQGLAPVGGSSSAVSQLAVHDCTPHVFKSVLLWIYTDKLDLDGMPPNDVVRV
jgi:hypothetical protein